jgi:N-acetyl-alpha-D-muramate 1-phosphate uridylyltransferase
MIKKAMILAAGFGKRMHPLTLKTPKPLLKIGKETLLHNTIKFLEKFGVKEIIINVHYLREQIIEYINKGKYNLKINIIEEKNEILDTGGGILNAIQYFSNKPFIIINPDTIWNEGYLKEIKLMEEIFFNENATKSILLLVDKKRSFDKCLKGDFSLKNNLVLRSNIDNSNFIYTGLQIIKPEVFSNIKNKIFSINRIWDELIKKSELCGIESHINFLHLSTLDIYKDLMKKDLNIK